MNLIGSLNVAWKQLSKPEGRDEGSGPGPVSYLLVYPACFHATVLSIFLDASLSVFRNASFSIPLQSEDDKSFLRLICVFFPTFSSCSVSLRSMCWCPFQSGMPQRHDILFLRSQGTSHGHPGGQDSGFLWIPPTQGGSRCPPTP